MDDTVADPGAGAQETAAPPALQPPTPPDLSPLKMLLYQAAGIPNPERKYQRDLENYYRQQSFMLQLQEQAHRNRDDALSLLKQAEPYEEKVSSINQTLARFPQFANEPNFVAMRSERDRLLATLQEIHGIARSTWDHGRAQSAALPAMAAHAVPPPQGMDQTADPFKGADIFALPSYSSPKEPYGTKGAPQKPSPASAKSEATGTPPTGIEQPQAPVDPITHWRSLLEGDAFRFPPGTPADGGTALRYVVNDKEAADVLRKKLSMIQDMPGIGESMPTVYVEDKESLYNDAINKRSALQAQRASISGKVSFYRALKISSDKEAMLRAASNQNQGDTALAREEGDNFATILSANDKDRSAIIDGIINDLQDQQKPLDKKIQDLDPAWDGYIRDILSPILPLSPEEFTAQYLREHNLKEPLTPEQEAAALKAWNAYRAGR